MASITTPREDVTLIDILIDGFEKNEILDGTHWRRLPMPDEGSAIVKFDALVAEATRWKGPPVLTENGKRRLAVWADMDIRQTRTWQSRLTAAREKNGLLSPSLVGAPF